MKPIMLQFEPRGLTPLYIQLYRYLKEEITCGRIEAGEKLPSLRRLSRDLSISITTTEQAYNQLLVEGYITSKPPVRLLRGLHHGQRHFQGSADPAAAYDFSTLYLSRKRL